MYISLVYFNSIIIDLFNYFLQNYIYLHYKNDEYNYDNNIIIMIIIKSDWWLIVYDASLPAGREAGPHPTHHAENGEILARQAAAERATATDRQENDKKTTINIKMSR